MKKTKLYSVLQTFDSKELRAFHDFVRSPFFNKQQELILLFQHLKKLAAKNYPNHKMSKEAIFKVLYPYIKYDEKRLNHLISQLFKLAETFLGYQQMQKAGLVSDYYALQAYVDRNQHKSYRYLYDQAHKKLASNPLRNTDYHFQQFLLADVAERHFSSQDVRRTDESLQQASDHLDHYFLAQKLKFVCAMLDRQMQLHTNYTTNMIEEINQYLSKKSFEEVPAIYLYFLTLLTLTTPDNHDHFFRLVEAFQKYRLLFDKNEQRDLYYFAINYCVRRIRVGEKAFANDLMDLYIQGLEKEILIDNGKLSPWAFKNMVKLGLGLKRFEWVEQFVPQYYEFLPEKEREVGFHYNMADLYFQKRDFNKAYDHLNQVEFTDIYYNLGAKVMLLKIYFEKDESEALLSLLKAFRIFLKRNKLVAKNVKEAYLNFVRLLSLIYKSSSKDYQPILKKIQTTVQLVDRGWLILQAKKDG